MKKFLLKMLLSLLIAWPIVSIAQAISDTFMSGGIAGIIYVMIAEELELRIKEEEK